MSENLTLQDNHLFKQLAYVDGQWIGADSAATYSSFSGHPAGSYRTEEEEEEEEPDTEGNNPEEDDDDEDELDK